MENQPIVSAQDALVEHGLGSEEGAADDGVYLFPLSPQQRRFWLADQQSPGNPAYNGAFRHELLGPVNPQCLEAAFNVLVGRHEALRATCRMVDQEPTLVVEPGLAIRLVFRDLRNVPVEQREIETERLCIADARHRFDVSKGPLIRVGLIRTDEERYVLTLTLHHIICDGWSIGLLMDELPQIYAALVDGASIDLPNLEIQFGDYLVWLHDQIEQPHISDQIAYWRGKLAGYNRLDVEPDLPASNAPTLDSDIVSCELPHELIQKLKAFSDAQGGTLFITSLTALMALLRQETGRDDLCIGSPVAGRTRPEVEKLVGPLLNHVLIRVHVDKDMTFRGLEAAVREALLEAFANQDAPLELVGEALRSNGQEVPEPFYSISFISQRAFAGGRNFTSDAAGVRIRTLPSKSQGALYDLFFFLIERENGWRLSLEYRTGLYSRSRAEELLDQLCGFLRQVADSSDAPVLSRPVFELANEDARKEEAAQQLPTGDVNDESGAEDSAGIGEIDGKDGWALPASFAQERFWLLAKAAPNNPAYNMPTCVWIEGFLDIEALSKSFDYVVERHESLRTTFEEQDGRLLQVIWPSLSPVLATRNVERISSTEIEYLKARALEKISPPFDLGRGPLIRAHLFRYSEAENLLVITLHHAICDGQSIGVLQRDLWRAYEALCDGQSPSIAPLNLQYGDFAVWQREWAESSAALSRMTYWKDALKPPLPVADFPLDRLPSGRPGSSAMESAKLSPGILKGLTDIGREHNVTRFMLTAAAFAILIARYSDHEDILFGCPAANRTEETDALIGPFAGPLALRFDLHGDPSLSEIIQRARDVILDGLVQPDLPFERLFESLSVRSIRGRNPLFQFYFTYQTAFLQSRTVRGLKITPISELSVGAPYEVQLSLIERANEVAAKLEYNPNLLDARTVREILAYYETVLECIVSNPRQRLSALPAPAVRRVVRAPELEHSDAKEKEYVAPGTELEAQLVKIWETLFERSPIGVQEDFFELGGHSLLAARLVLEVKKEIGVRIDLSTLTEARTIRQLAIKLQSPSDLSVSRAIALQPKGHKPPLFCMHGVGGHVFHFVAFAAAAPEDQPVYALAPPQPEFASDIKSLGDLAEYYNREIREVQPRGPYHLCGYSLGGPLAFEMARLLKQAGEEVGKLIVLDSPNPQYYGSLKGAKLAQFRLLRLAQNGPGIAAKALRKLLPRDVGAATELEDAQLEATQSNEEQLAFLSALRQEFTLQPSELEVVLFRSNEAPEYDVNASLGWEQIALKGVKVIRTGGDHLSMMKRPLVAKVMQFILSEIDR